MRALADVLLFAHYATAISLPAFRRKSLGGSLSRRADEEGNVTIPAAISIGPSQYWDGNGMRVAYCRLDGTGD